MSFNDSLSEKLVSIFNEYTNEHPAIEMISLATADGFAVHHLSKIGHSFDGETMAAAASTLYSVSNAVAQQILSKHFKITFIESDEGNVAFVALQVNGKDFVLSMSATGSMNIANLRLTINRMAGEISAIHIANVA